MQMSKQDPEHSTRSNTTQTNKIILHMAPQNCEAYTIFTNGLNIKLETHVINMIQKYYTSSHENEIRNCQANGNRSRNCIHEINEGCVKKLNR